MAVELREKPIVAPSPHKIGGAHHTPDTIANLQTKITDAVLATIADIAIEAAARAAADAAHAALTAMGVHGSAILATPNTLVHRDAAGRSQIANPAVNADIDNMGSRDAAIVALKFINLPDTPASYTGQANKVPVVNAAENALQFAARGLELIHNHYFSAAATSYTISGLDGDNDIQYYISMFLIWNSINPGGVLLRPNNDAGNNYPRIWIYADGIAVGTGTDIPNGFWVAYANALNDIFICPMMCLHAVSGQARPMLGFRHKQDLWFSFIARWTNTVNNITSLVFVASQANGIGIGSRITVWRLPRV